MSSDNLGELIYFPVMAKGLQLACIAEMSGLPWTGFTVEESGPKSWTEIKDSGIAPFGQMPLLKTPDGLVLGQSVAIANYIAKMAGAALEARHRDPPWHWDAIGLRRDRLQPLPLRARAASVQAPVVPVIRHRNMLYRSIESPGLSLRRGSQRSARPLLRGWATSG